MVTDVTVAMKMSSLRQHYLVRFIRSTALAVLSARWCEPPCVADAIAPVCLAVASLFALATARRHMAYLVALSQRRSPAHALVARALLP
ncbi:hypothetical protein GCM10011591_24380 [Nocardia camponoti]|uniref:Uncharacterized protein n=1 Tax=Nocardia camponoti TaxID=1616106 RepID=A0A917V9C4_9NOCA|nr:hypothetical protein GCM10011591_24380 [Nocardia camponoti]